MWGLSSLVLVLAIIATSEQGKVKIPRGDFNVEVYFVVDEQALAKYLTEEKNDVNKAQASVRSDIDFFLTEVNKLYSSFFKSKIRISVRKIDLIKGQAFKSYYGDKVDEKAALTEFDTWLEEQSSMTKYNYDIAILFTGFNLWNGKDDFTLGFAHVGTVCKNNVNSGVVELDGTYNTVVTTAHEIAHILGANHDDQASTYVMAPTSSMDGENRWFFSLCSASNTWDVINRLKGENCMLRSSVGSITPNSMVTANLINPDVICKRKFGAGHYFSHHKVVYGNQPPAGDAVCKKFYCARRGYNTIIAMIATDGMPCDVKKTCKQGTCQTDWKSAARAVKDNKCVFGDQELVSKTEMSCAAYLKLNGALHSCGPVWFKEKCCATYKTLNCEQKKNPLCKDPARPVKCKSSDRCIPFHYVCDNYNDCWDKSDEGPEVCPKKKRDLLDILLDKTLDQRGLINALETRADNFDSEDDDEDTKVIVEEHHQRIVQEYAELTEMA